MEQLGLIEWCASCWRWEEVTPGAYRGCLECGHTYKTPQELVEAYNWVAEPLNLAETAEDVPFCPFCLHDF